MPWKNEKDPYRIWLSEIILQQTRVEQGWAYYEKFVETFPTVKDLARAPEKKVFKLWEGLGYYTRCRNLIHTAKKISVDYKGRFPSTYHQISELKGIGPYTAAAIASFAFNLPYPVVDGNVQRVIARYFGIAIPANTSAEKKIYYDLAVALMDKRSPAIYNQAIMDLGALICKPQSPLCNQCPQSGDCIAKKHGWTNSLPVKKKKLKKKERWFYYFLIKNSDRQIYIRQRTGKDIWKNLYEFALCEKDSPLDEHASSFRKLAEQVLGIKTFQIKSFSEHYTQQLTHQTIHGRIIVVEIRKTIAALKAYRAIGKKQMKSFPFPRMIANYLENPVHQLF
jgi:A/G-specific adenine glycosylase